MTISPFRPCRHNELTRCDSLWQTTVCFQQVSLWMANRMKAPTKELFRFLATDFSLLLAQRRYRDRNIEGRCGDSHAAFARCRWKRTACAPSLASRGPENQAQHPGRRSRAVGWNGLNEIGRGLLLGAAEGCAVRLPGNQPQAGRQFCRCQGRNETSSVHMLGPSALQSGNRCFLRGHHGVRIIQHWR